MGLGHYLFSFRGRINRAKQWAALLVALAHYILLGVALSFTIGGGPIVDLLDGKTTLAAIAATPQAHAFAALFLALELLGLYIGLAIATKRLHDRNKSAWWLLVFIALPLVLQIPAIMAMPTMFAHLAALMHAIQAHAPPPPMPLETPLVTISRGAATIIGLWAFVELYILKGTEGDNRFGPDPLAKH